MKKKIFWKILACVLLLSGVLATPAWAAHRILFIDSYHEGFEWSDGVAAGVRSVLNEPDITLKTFHMDTLRNTSESAKKRAALNALYTIRSFKPDVVIASDDEASAYLIVPYLKNADLPVVFCGVDFSAEHYGFPCSNVTGMVELPPAVALIYSLTHFKRIVMVGYLAADTPTAMHDCEYVNQEINEAFVGIFVKSFKDWKKEFKHLQDKVEVLILGNKEGIENWDDTQALDYVKINSKIPTGCLSDRMTPFVFLGATRIAKEQGVYAATTALKILNGTPVSTIPVVNNVQANFTINKKIADRIGISIPESYLNIANKIIE